MVRREVCTDFEAQLVQMDGESNHVHLLVNYPPKVSVWLLVNSLKGVSSFTPPVAANRKMLWEECLVLAFLLCRFMRWSTT